MMKYLFLAFIASLTAEILIVLQTFTRRHTQSWPWWLNSLAIQLPTAAVIFALLYLLYR